MKIKVDPDLCEGHNRCFALAPDLFEVDDYGLSRALNDGVVPPTDRWNNPSIDMVTAVSVSSLAGSRPVRRKYLDAIAAGLDGTASPASPG